MWKVIGECIDARTGRRYQRGEIFEPPPDDDQADRLLKAECIREVADAAAGSDEPKQDGSADAAAGNEAAAGAQPQKTAAKPRARR